MTFDTSQGPLFNKPLYLPAALLGGGLSGALSAVPYVNCINCCFFAWVVAGGVLAVRWVDRRAASPVELPEAAFIGLLAGSISGLVAGSVWLAMHLAFNTAGVLQGMTGNNLSSLRWLQQSSSLATAAMLCILLVVHPMFGTIGGALAATLLRGAPRPPLAAEPSSRWTPPFPEEPID